MQLAQTNAAEKETLKQAFKELEGARVLVTGSGGGIGAAIAKAFGSCTAIVGVHYNSNKAGADTVCASIRSTGGTGIPFQADLQQRGGAAELVERFVANVGGLDILVNNAGGPELLRTVVELTDDDFDRIFDLNARCVFEACRAAVPHLRQSKRSACIINVTSLSSRVGSGPKASVYGASKAFVAAFMKSLARELAVDGIRVNALSPGFIASPLHEKISSPQMVANWVGQIPLGRAGNPDDCAGAALYLASSKLSGFVTGQTIEVNGGQFMGS